MSSHFLGIGERFKRLRGDVSQKDFAKKLTIPYWSYSRFETEERPPSLKSLYKIKKILGISIDWLLWGDTTDQSMKTMKPISVKDEIRENILKDFDHRCMICHLQHHESLLKIVPIQRTKTKLKKNDLMILCPICYERLDKGIIPLKIAKVLRNIALDYIKRSRVQR